MRRKHLIAALALSGAAALPAAAQHGKWYGVLSGGQAKTDSSFISNREGAISDATNVRSSFDDKDSAWRAAFGYRFNPWIALEVNYADYGSIRSDTRFDAPGAGSGSVMVDREVKGYGVDAVVSWPLGERFSVFGRVGALNAETRAKGIIAGDVFFSDGSPCCEKNTKTNETIVKYGLGLDWNITPQIAARLEYERLSDVGKKFGFDSGNGTGEGDIDAWFLGVLMRF